MASPLSVSVDSVSMDTVRSLSAEGFTGRETTGAPGRLFSVVEAEAVAPSSVPSFGVTTTSHVSPAVRELSEMVAVMSVVGLLFFVHA